MTMLLEKTGTRTFEDQQKRLTEAIQAGGFGILATHDFKETLEGKGIPFQSRCVVFAVCKPPLAVRVLDRKIEVSSMLPCRIALYERDGRPVIGMASPVHMIRAITDDPELHEIAREVEDQLRQIMDASL